MQRSAVTSRGLRLSTESTDHPPALSGQGQIGPSVRAAALEKEASAQAAFSQSDNLAMAQPGEIGSQRGDWVETILDRLDDRRQQLLGLDLRLSHRSGFGKDINGVGKSHAQGADASTATASPTFGAIPCSHHPGNADDPRSPGINSARGSCHRTSRRPAARLTVPALRHSRRKQAAEIQLG
jgi:hypothetical protein